MGSPIPLPPWQYIQLARFHLFTVRHVQPSFTALPIYQPRKRPDGEKDTCDFLILPKDGQVPVITLWETAINRGQIRSV